MMATLFLGDLKMKSSFSTPSLIRPFQKEKVQLRVSEGRTGVFVGLAFSLLSREIENKKFP